MLDQLVSPVSKRVLHNNMAHFETLPQIHLAFRTSYENFTHLLNNHDSSF